MSGQPPGPLRVDRHQGIQSELEIPASTICGRITLERPSIAYQGVRLDLELKGAGVAGSIYLESANPKGRYNCRVDYKRRAYWKDAEHAAALVDYPDPTQPYPLRIIDDEAARHPPLLPECHTVTLQCDVWVDRAYRIPGPQPCVNIPPVARMRLELDMDAGMMVTSEAVAEKLCVGIVRNGTIRDRDRRPSMPDASVQRRRSRTFAPNQYS